MVSAPFAIFYVNSIWGEPLPTQLLQHDRKTPVEGGNYFCLTFGESKEVFCRENHQGRKGRMQIGTFGTYL